MRKVKEAIKRRISDRPWLAAVVDRLRKRPLWHRVRRRISGKRNRWQAHWTCVIDGVSVEIHGNNNSIEIGANAVLRGVSIRIWGDGHRISLGDNVRFNRGGTVWFEDAEGILTIGSNTTFEAADISITERGSSVVIGSDCMLAYDIDIRTGDSHSILDADTQRRINPAANVRLGDHVWIAAHCTLLKGSGLAADSILATGSVLTKTIEERGCIVGGIPAGILKRGITWDRRRL